jgi:hypothetical protein
MRADFFREENPGTVIGSAEWDGRRAVIRAEDDEVRTALEDVFRVSPVGVDDPMPPGRTKVVGPGDLDWFRAAAAIRGAEEGLAVRFVTEVAGRWDPALDPQTYGWGGRKPALPSR